MSDRATGKPPRHRVERDQGSFVVPAPLLAEAFGLDEAAVRSAMRDGRLTSRCEAGLDEDAGKWRLTFQFGGRALRLVVDDDGDILQRASFPVRHGQGGTPRGGGAT